jgi:hypothetical protein
MSETNWILTAECLGGPRDGESMSALVIGLIPAQYGLGQQLYDESGGWYHAGRNKAGKPAWVHTKYRP